MTVFESPVLAIVIETAKLRWYIVGLSPAGDISPLLRSQVGDFDNYLGADFDEQVTFLRHRFSGVIQRGADRLLREGMRPGRIVFLADGPFQRASRELTDRVADHFVQWLNQPPVLFLMGLLGAENPSLERLAGEPDQQLESALCELAPSIAALMRDSQAWETAPRKRELADPRVESV